MKATIFVDVQNDFIDGALGCEMAKQTIDDLVKYAEICAANKDRMMIATQDTHKPSWSKTNDDLPYKTEGGYLWTLEGEKLPVEHCIENTPGWELRDGLYDAMKKKYGDNMHNFIITKPTFGSENLVNQMWTYIEAAKEIGNEITEIEICGYCTSICVISNALLLRAAFPNMKISLLSNICGDINEESHQAAMTVARNCQIDVIDDMDLS